jgi:hypothetical protein
MRPEIKAKWKADLLSGEYEQGEGKLCRILTGSSAGVKRWCCLGVLTDQAVKAGVGTWNDDLIDIRGYVPPGSPVGYVGEINYLPEAVAEWAGITPEGHEPVWGYHTGRLPSGGEHRSLSEANDHGARFEVIAELIEEHF